MKTTIFNTIIFLTVISTQAQTSLNSSGNTSTNTGGSISYSIGQLVTTTTSTPQGSISQGVQQPYTIETTSGTNITTIQLTVTAYPNPVTNLLHLDVEDPTGLVYILNSLNGSIVEHNSLTDKETIIQMQQLPSGTYFLNVNSSTKTIKTFKIIKN